LLGFSITENLDYGCFGKYVDIEVPQAVLLDIVFEVVVVFVTPWKLWAVWVVISLSPWLPH